MKKILIICAAAAMCSRAHAHPPGQATVVRHDFLACETIEGLRKAATSTEMKSSEWAFKAVLAWGCRMLTVGDVVYVDRTDGRFAHLHKSDEPQGLWTLTVVLK